MDGLQENATVTTTTTNIITTTTTAVYFKSLGGSDWMRLFKEWLDERNTTWRGEPVVVDILENVYTPKTFVYVCVCLLLPAGIVGNALLLRMCLHPDLRSYSYSVYLSIMSVSDTITVLLLQVPTLLTAHGRDIIFYMNNVHLCRLYTLLAGMCLTGSRWTLVAFSVDRYVAIAIPLKRKVFCTPRNARIGCTVAAAFAVILQVPATIGMELVPFMGKRLCAVVDETIYAWANVEVAINTLGPCFVLAVFNTLALRAVKRGMKTRLTMRTTAGQVDGESQRQTDQQVESRKLTLALLSIPVCAFLTMAPHSLVYAYIHLSITTLPSENMFDAIIKKSEIYCRNLLSVNYVINFYLLMATSSAYRRISRKLFTCRSSD